MIDIVDPDRPPLSRDPPREPLADRDLHPPLDLLLDPLRRTRTQRHARLVEQQDRRRIGPQDLRDPLQQLTQQLLLRQIRQRRISNALQRPQAAIGRLRLHPCPPLLLVERGVLDRDRHPIGRQLQQITLIIGEQPSLQAAHMQHPQHPILRQQRNPQQRADPLLAQDRIQDVGMIDIVDPDRPPLSRDPPREPLADRDLHPPLDLLLDPLRRTRTQRHARLVKQQDRRRIGAQDLRDPLQQLTQQLLLRQIRQRRIRDALQRFEHLPAGLEAEARGALGDVRHARIIRAPRAPRS